MHSSGEGAGARPSRERRRRQLLAAARQSDRAAWDARLATLIAGYPVVYEGTGQARLRPSAEFIGYRDSRLVVSISSPASPQTAVDQFSLACRTLAALGPSTVRDTVGVVGMVKRRCPKATLSPGILAHDPGAVHGKRLL